MRDIPRGKGYDKASIIGWHNGYVSGSGNKFARRHKMIPDFFQRSLEKYIPNHGIPFEYNTCGYCKRKFAYSVKTQKFCSPKCGADAKRDKEYFAGNRRKTVGLADRICQICGGSPKKGIASHHVYGKVNDPKGKTLVALCPGCHDLVTKLGGRNFVGDENIWGTLIWFAHLRKYGPNKSLKVKVTIES